MVVRCFFNTVFGCFQSRWIDCLFIDQNVFIGTLVHGWVFLDFKENGIKLQDMRGGNVHIIALLELVLLNLQILTISVHIVFIFRIAVATLLILVNVDLISLLFPHYQYSQKDNTDWLA